MDVLRRLYTGALLLAIFFFLTGTLSPASAHEVYVLNHHQFSEGMHTAPLNLFRALAKPANLQLTIILVILTLVVLLVLFYFRYTKIGQQLDKFLKHFSSFGLLVIRMALAASFFYAASTRVIFGPELLLQPLLFHQFLPFVEYLVGFLLLVGLYTEVAAGLALMLYVLAIVSYGWYLLTYVNYLGEIVALILFGSRFFSIDKLLFGKLRRFADFKQYENTLIRICYGTTLLYAAINIKIIHSQIALDVVNQYHLNNFHWLFPRDPLLIVLGAAIVEVVVAVFIILGFSTRFTNLVLMFYLTLSIIFFKEAVWPHYMLYGISVSLLFNGSGKLSVDEALRKVMLHRKSKKISKKRK